MLFRSLPTMFPGLRLISAVLLSLTLSASAGVIRHSTSPVTLALTKQFNLTGGSKILEIDQARAKALKARTRLSQQAGPYNIPLGNQAVFYSTPVSGDCPPVPHARVRLTGDDRLGLATRRRTVGTSLPSERCEIDGVRGADQLIIDTGSSNTWVGADAANLFIPSTSKPTGEALVRKFQHSGVVFVVDKRNSGERG